MLDINTINQKMNELKLIKHNSLIGLVDCLSDGNYRLKPNILPDKGAVYAFWWSGSLSYLKSNKVNRVIKFKGPNSRRVNVEFTDSWLDNISIEGRIPLYVGKTADSLKKRISLHLQLNLRRGLSLGDTALDEERKTSSNQVRDRIERMFLDEEDIRSLMINNISLSYVLLDGDSDSVNRFYLEDRAIGNLLPLFNIDIER